MLSSGTRIPRRYVAHALSPAQVLAVRLLPDTNTAEVAVPNKQLSLAIGKEGQNARLAARLTSLRIDIKPQSLAEKLVEEGLGPLAPQPELPKPVAPEPTTVEPQPTALPTPEPVTAAAAAPLPHAANCRSRIPEEPVIEEEEIEPAAAELEVAAPLPSEPGKIPASRRKCWRVPAWNPSRRNGVRSAT